MESKYTGKFAVRFADKNNGGADRLTEQPKMNRVTLEIQRRTTSYLENKNANDCCNNYQC